MVGDFDGYKKSCHDVVSGRYSDGDISLLWLCGDLIIDLIVLTFSVSWLGLAIWYEDLIL